MSELITAPAPSPPRTSKPSSIARPAASTTRSGTAGSRYYAPTADVLDAGLGRRRHADRQIRRREISLIYYGIKQGLEDRVFRIRTERSSATSLPEPRTSHNITNVEILEQSDGRL